ncbi:Long chronological lifespan protein 2 [Savitreella phatthalungensis]
MRSFIITLAALLVSVHAQFQFFDQMFGGQQGQRPNGGGGGSNGGRLAHGVDWYHEQIAESHCASGEFVCPRSLDCVKEPKDCPCPHGLERCHVGDTYSVCVSKREGVDVCKDLQKMHETL